MVNAIEAEQAVMGSILIDARCLPEVTAALTAEDFGMETHKAIYRAALSLQAAGTAVDAITVMEQTRKDGQAVPPEYLKQLMDATPTAANVGEYIPIVRENAMRRGVLALATRIQTAVNDGTADAAELLAELSAGCAALEQEGPRQNLLGPMELALRWIDHRIKVESGESRAFVPTGYRDLDYILGGGLIASGMHVLAARPGMGKTTLALNIADRVAQNVGPVLFVSLEMDDEQITAKRLSRESGVPAHRLLMDAELTEEENAKQAGANDRLLMRPLHLNAKPSATVAEVAAMARQVKGLKLIVIDYLGKIARGKNSARASLYEHTTEVSGEIKVLARTMKVPVLVLAQINRESEKRADKRPNLADLRDTGAIEQDADTVTFLYRQDYYGNPADKDPYMPDETECIVAKNRHAGVGELKLAFYAATSKFSTTNTDPRSGYRKALATGNA